MPLVTSTEQTQQQPANILTDELPTMQANKTTRSIMTQTWEIK